MIKQCLRQRLTTCVVKRDSQCNCFASAYSRISPFWQRIAAANSAGYALHSTGDAFLSRNSNLLDAVRPVLCHTTFVVYGVDMRRLRTLTAFSRRT